MMGAARAAPAEARGAMEREEEEATQAVTASSERAAGVALQRVQRRVRRVGDVCWASAKALFASNAG